MDQKLQEHQNYIRENGIDLPEVLDWKWKNLTNKMIKSIPQNRIFTLIKKLKKTEKDWKNGQSFSFLGSETKLFTCKPPINPIKWCKEKIFHSIPSFKKHNMISIYVSMNFVTFYCRK